MTAPRKIRQQLKKLASTAQSPSETEPAWTFLTNHAHVLLCVAKDPEARMKDVARLVGITERAVQRILIELEDAGYIKRIRQGRRNHYEIHSDLPLRHPIERHERVSSLIMFVLGKSERTRSGRTGPVYDGEKKASP